MWRVDGLHTVGVNGPVQVEMESLVSTETLDFLSRADAFAGIAAVDARRHLGLGRRSEQTPLVNRHPALR